MHTTLRGNLPFAACSTALLEQNASPSDADIDAAMDGHICRCAAYVQLHASYPPPDVL
ncbi:2Fe-2S iron-sulfur cluster-binding protein [Klebsiella pneumoniae]|uniref:2Fe-2S iron-sulfur cluster-binding protein n=1 Tax=Klebsiella pneumoniae TaxID=573 RepID=UPI0039696730